MSRLGRRTARMAAFVVGTVALSLTGCTAITIAPSCPSELQVGQSGAVQANERNPGAIPTYQWQVIPPSAGRVESSTSANTSLQALEEGALVVRLTASDGLFQMIADCTVTVRGIVAGAVTLSASPNPATTGETVTLSCDSIGPVVPVSRTIGQLSEDPVDLTVESEGIATFTAHQPGEYVFLCFSENADGLISDPVFTTVQIQASPGNDNDNGDGNDNANDNENVNANDNGNVNENTNGGRRPPRTGGRG